MQLSSSGILTCAQNGSHDGQRETNHPYQMLWKIPHLSSNAVSITVVGVWSGTSGFSVLVAFL